MRTNSLSQFFSFQIGNERDNHDSSPLLQMGRYENNDIFTATISTMYVMRNGWKYLFSTVNANWNELKSYKSHKIFQTFFRGQIIIFNIMKGKDKKIILCLWKSVR